MSKRVGYSVVGLAVVLVLVLTVVPLLKSYFPYYFPEGFTSSRQPDCVGVTCPEGQFCQQNKCHPVYVANSA